MSSSYQSYANHRKTAKLITRRDVARDRGFRRNERTMSRMFRPREPEEYKGPRRITLHPRYTMGLHVKREYPVKQRIDSAEKAAFIQGAWGCTIRLENL